jgi:hypothetical protein
MRTHIVARRDLDCAMGKRPTELRDMRRFAEVVALARAAHPTDKFFDGVELSVRHLASARTHCWAYERAFATLDSNSWKLLRSKAVAHFTDHREGQRKQGFYNQLNEAFAYQLLRRRGYKGVKVLPETGNSTPDLEYAEERQSRFCEVKTIGISDAVIQRRKGVVAFNTYALYHELSQQFIEKVESAIDLAGKQIKSRGDGGLVFLVIHFDDFTLQHYPRYRRQIVACLNSHPAENIYVKIGTAERKFLTKGPIGNVRRI